MSNSSFNFRSIAPKPSKPQEFFAQNPNILAVATSPLAPTFSLDSTLPLDPTLLDPTLLNPTLPLVPTFPLVPNFPTSTSTSRPPLLETQKTTTQLVEPTSAIIKPNILKKKGEKPKKKNTSQSTSVEDDTGWGDDNTKLLLKFLEENFASYKKNKSNFAKKVSAQLFSGKPWEQIKNKLSRLVTKYNNIKEKENQTGQEAQAKWKWFERMDILFGTRENHNPGFLVDGFSKETELFNNFEEKEKEKEIKEESPNKSNSSIKKWKLPPQDSLAEAILSMSNTKQVVWEKRLTFESEQLEKRQKVEKETREAEISVKREELAIERLRNDTLQKKMEFDIEQSRMKFQLRMKELDIKMMQFKPSSE